MDVSAQTIRQVEFREKLRGYHQDDVDEFLERVAAGVDILQERLREATERAVRAEQKSTESHEDDESLRRTLVLAQRTADLAVKEGREQAARLLEDARDEAAATIAAAAEEASRIAAEADAQVRADVERLEAARRQLQQDVDLLVGYLDEQRARAKAVLIEAARHLDEALTPDPPRQSSPDSGWTGVPSSEGTADNVGPGYFDTQAGGIEAPAGVEFPRQI